jgi:hypothetical protein
LGFGEGAWTGLRDGTSLKFGTRTRNGDDGGVAEGLGVLLGGGGEGLLYRAEAGIAEATGEAGEDGVAHGSAVFDVGDNVVDAAEVLRQGVGVIVAALGLAAVVSGDSVDEFEAEAVEVHRFGLEGGPGVGGLDA